MLVSCHSTTGTETRSLTRTRELARFRFSGKAVTLSADRKSGAYIYIHYQLDMSRFTAYAIVAVVLLLSGFPQSSLAVTCDSFTSAAACDGVFTDAGRCKWNAATRTCETSGESLPEGMVGITSIPDNVELTPGPSGSEGSSGTFGSPPPVNGSGLESMAYAPAPEPENLPLSRIFEDGNVQAAAGPGGDC